MQRLQREVNLAVGSEQKVTRFVAAVNTQNIIRRHAEIGKVAVRAGASRSSQRGPTPAWRVPGTQDIPASV